MKNTTRRSSVSVEGARAAVSSLLRPLETEYCGLINALGRIAADDLRIPGDIPPYNTALLDGYAVHAANTSGATETSPITLGVLSQSVTHGTRNLDTGTVVRVRAGGRLPAGADAVVPPGGVFRSPDDPQAHVMIEVAPGDNTARAGSLASAGEVILPRGSLIRSGEIALAASVGVTGIAVTRRPRVAVITTGQDVVEVAEELSDGQTRNAARYALAGMALECGCELGRLSHVRDGRKGLESALRACAGCDAVLAAVSPRDRMGMAVESLCGAGEVVFERVQMSPGGSGTAFGIVDGRPVFVLPAEWALEVFEAVVRPALLTMMGARELDRPRTPAILTVNLRLDPAYRHFLKAFTRCEDGQWTTEPMVSHECGARKWAQPNSLIVIPENTAQVRRGQGVEAALLR